MSVEYVNRSWVTKQAPLLLGCLIVSGACERRDQNTRGVVGTSSAAGLGEVAAAPDVAPETRLRPFPPEEPRLPVRGAPGHYSGAYDSGAMPNARAVALGAQGTVFVSTRPEDEIYALVDDDGDHKVDRVHSVARGLDISNWSTYGDGASSEIISRVLGIDGFEARLDRLPKPVVVITDKLPAREHHGWRYVRFGAGGWLYVTVRVHHQA